MASSSPKRRTAAWRGRPLHARAADLAVAAFVVLLTAAVIVNSIADTHDGRRVAVDKRVMAAYLAGRPDGAAFGAPFIKVHRTSDLVCAFRRGGHDGICLTVDGHTTATRTITNTYSCVDVPTAPKNVKHWQAPPPPAGERYCPIHLRKII